MNTKFIIADYVNDRAGRTEEFYFVSYRKWIAGRIMNGEHGEANEAFKLNSFVENKEKLIQLASWGKRNIIVK